MSVKRIKGRWEERKKSREEYTYASAKLLIVFPIFAPCTPSASGLDGPAPFVTSPIASSVAFSLSCLHHQTDVSDHKQPLRVKSVKRNQRDTDRSIVYTFCIFPTAMILFLISCRRRWISSGDGAGSAGISSASSRLSASTSVSSSSLQTLKTASSISVTAD